MLAINRILVPTDFSPVAADAYAYAVRLADIIGAEIQLIHCVYPAAELAEVPGFQLEATARMVTQAERQLGDFAEEGLTKVARQLKSVPVIRTHVPVGGAVPTIKERAAKENFELVIMGSRGARDFWRQLFGTNASEVLHNAPCPVMIIPEGATFEEFRQLLMATDLAGDDVWEGRELIDFLHPMTPDLHLVHVSNSDAKEAAFDFDTVLELYHRQHPRFRVDCTEIEGGNVRDEVLNLATEIGADLIVMSRPHYRLFDSLFHKSYTREMALSTTVPLLVLNE